MSNAIELLEIGMSADVQKLNTISHNLANVNTVGYKRQVAFSDMIQMVQQNQGRLDNPNALYRALIDYAGGAIKQTGNPLDLALQGDGFLSVQSADGNQALYTRQGSLRLDAQGRLVTQNGEALLSNGGDAIRLNGIDVKIDKQGRVWEKQQQVAQLRLVRFENMNKLVPVGANLFRDEGAAPVMLTDTDLKDTAVMQGFLESSNVKTQDEMVKLIGTMRHFEISQRAVKAYDEIMEKAIRTLGEF